MANKAQVKDMETLFSEIHSLYLKCFKESSSHVISNTNASNYIMQLLATCEVITIKRKDNVVGVLIYQQFHNTLLNGKELFIHEWFIHPLWRKKLVGYQLYQEIIRIGKERGCSRLRGLCFNSEMIRTVRSQKETKAVAVMFEREL